MCASITKLSFFSNYYRRCADPFRSHKNVVKTILHVVTLEEFGLYCIRFLQDKNYVFVVKTKKLLRKKENTNVDIEHENENEVMNAGQSKTPKSQVFELIFNFSLS